MILPVLLWLGWWQGQALRLWWLQLAGHRLLRTHAAGVVVGAVGVEAVVVEVNLVGNRQQVP